MSELGIRLDAPGETLPNPREADNVVYDPSMDELRSFSEHLETTTEFGAPAYVSDVRSRSADRTANAVDADFGAADHRHVETAYEAAVEREMVCLDRQLGRHPEHTYVCRLFVPREHARIALAWAKLFEPVGTAASKSTDDGTTAPATLPEPDFYTVQLPDHDEVAIRVLPDEGMTAVLGSDYIGEAKKSFLRLYMYRVKQAGGLGLHAGTKRVRIEPENGSADEDENDRASGGEDGPKGETETVGQLFLGLSGTGKSTLTAHGLGLEPPEEATMLQDDVCGLLPDGTVTGSEGEGLFIKTIGLDPDEQPALHEAATDESAVLENVDVADDGTVDFDGDRYTANTRAVIQREQLPSAAEEIDLPEADQVFFITRNPAMPPIAQLTPEGAAAAFMLGESVQTSAGDPSKAGEAIRVVGTNPFIVGSEGEEGNRFRDLIADLDVECYLLNTGSVGDRDVRVEDTVAILEAVTRGTIEWGADDATGLTVPEAVPGVDVSRFDVADALDDHETHIRKLRAERRTHLATFDDLDEDIADAVY